MLAVAASGCGEGTSSGQTAAAAIAPVQQESPPIVSEKEVSEAIEFRQQYGLRADRTWVRAVADDPAAQIGIPEYGVPLLPDEFNDLVARRWDPDLLEQVRGYGLLFPDDFGGAGINLEASGAIIYFKNRVDRHRAALFNLVPAGSAVEVREVEWSLGDLKGFVERVLADKAWFDSIGVTVKAFGHIDDNAVQLTFRGPEEAAGMIEEHFGNPTWLNAYWTGALPWEGPRADLTITVTDTNGQPVKNVRCDFTPVDPTVDVDGDGVFGTNAAGICLLENMPTAVFAFALHQWVDSGYDPTPIKTFRIAVEPGGTATNVVVPAN